MNRQRDRQRLLEAVFAEDSSSDFGAAVLRETIRFAERRRRLRSITRVAAGGAMIVLAALFWWRTSMPRHSDAAACVIVRTQPLASAAIIRTRTFPLTYVVATNHEVGIVHTIPRRGGVHLMTDDELLAAFAAQHPVLVRVGPRAQELIFTTDRAANRVN